jgi:hypothetical protein
VVHCRFVVGQHADCFDFSVFLFCFHCFVRNQGRSAQKYEVNNSKFEICYYQDVCEKLAPGDGLMIWAELLWSITGHHITVEL